jgi:hypothetical protein
MTSAAVVKNQIKFTVEVHRIAKSKIVSLFQYWCTLIFVHLQDVSFHSGDVCMYVRGGP